MKLFNPASWFAPYEGSPRVHGEELERLRAMSDEELEQLAATIPIAPHLRESGVPTPAQPFAYDARIELRRRAAERRMTASGAKHAAIGGVAVTAIAAATGRKHPVVYGAAAALIGWMIGRDKARPRGAF